MGLLDSVLGGVLGGGGTATPGAQAAPGGITSDVLLRSIGGMITQHGGLGGLLNSLTQAGHGDAVNSWIGTGQNLPISPGALTQVLGSPQVAALAQKLGINPQQVGSLLAQALPHIVDQLTPHGQLPPTAAQQGDLLHAALGALQGKLFGAR